MAKTKWAVCPGCQQYGKFTSEGEQHWPADIAAAHGLPAVIPLWTCPHCHTTISETEFSTPRKPRLARA
jgi:hypothetical protein